MCVGERERKRVRLDSRCMQCVVSRFANSLSFDESLPFAFVRTTIFSYLSTLVTTFQSLTLTLSFHVCRHSNDLTKKTFRSHRITQMMLSGYLSLSLSFFLAHTQTPGLAVMETIEGVLCKNRFFDSVHKNVLTLHTTNNLNGRHTHTHTHTQ